MEIEPLNLYEFLRQKLGDGDVSGAAYLERLLEVLVVRVPSAPQSDSEQLLEPTLHRMCSETRTGTGAGAAVALRTTADSVWRLPCADARVPLDVPFLEGIRAFLGTRRTFHYLAAHASCQSGLAGVSDAVWYRLKQILFREDILSSLLVLIDLHSARLIRGDSQREIGKRYNNYASNEKELFLKTLDLLMPLAEMPVQFRGRPVDTSFLHDIRRVVDNWGF